MIQRLLIPRQRYKKGGKMPAAVEELRVRNLRHACGEERGGRRRMADKLGMSESQLSQIIGKKPTKKIGSTLARNAERKLGLPRGWLDTEDHDLSQDTKELARQIQALSPESRRHLAALIKQLK